VVPPIFRSRARTSNRAPSIRSATCPTRHLKPSHRHECQPRRGRGVANGINTVHLSYVRARTGHALIDARHWIPQEHIEDPVKSLVMGLPY